MKSITRIASFYFKNLKIIAKLDFVNVHLRLETRNLPPMTMDISPLTVEEMDMGDEAQIKYWLEIHNDAFERNWKREKYETKFLNHPLIKILKVYFVMDGTKPIAATSTGVWRKNTQIGVGQYAAVRKEYQNRGIGKYLFLYRAHKQKDMGVEIIDNQTNLSHSKAIMVYFDTGYVIKDRPDPWNTPDFFPSIIRRIVNYRLRKLYLHWKAFRNDRA
jgi:GNAT superfamily N-acetyltransferase